MNAHPGYVLAELRKLVLEEIEDKSHILEKGNSIVDYASYKEAVGRLYSLRRVLEFFDEAESIAEKRT